VLAETVRGRTADAPVNRVVTAVGETLEASSASGRLAGELLGSADSIATIDALVVASAVERGGAVILTGDPSDLSALAADHPEVVIHPL